jgi:short-subunit dehydrogenase
MNISGKVALVTGAGSGMGRHITLELLHKGADVVALDMHQGALEETRALAGSLAPHVKTIVLDVTDRAAVSELPSQTGPIDILINNAGIIQPFVPIKDLDIHAAERVMNVNFYGPLHLIKAYLPTLLERPEAHILNVSSMGAYAPVPGQSIYGASKAAVKLMTEGLRSELMNTRIGVTVAFPGAVNTNITTNSGIAMPEVDADSSKFKSMNADAAARIMVEAIEKGKPRVTVGKDATMMDRLSRINPVFAANLIYKQMKSLLK